MQEAEEVAQSQERSDDTRIPVASVLPDTTALVAERPSGADVATSPRSPVRMVAAAVIVIGMLLILALLAVRPPVVLVAASPEAKGALSAPAFEVWKIVLEKVVLAVPIAIAGAVAAWLIEDRKRLRDAAERRVREREEAELKRLRVPRTQLSIECTFHGPEPGGIIAAIRLVAENKGETIRVIDRLRFSVYAMLEGEQASLYTSKDGLSRLALRGGRVSTSTRDFTYSIEPGIRQVFPLTTLIDARARYVVIKVELRNRTTSEDPGSHLLWEERFMPVVIEPRDPVGAPD